MYFNISQLHMFSNVYTPNLRRSATEAQLGLADEFEFEFDLKFDDRVRIRVSRSSTSLSSSSTSSSTIEFEFESFQFGFLGNRFRCESRVPFFGDPFSVPFRVHSETLVAVPVGVPGGTRKGPLVTVDKFPP